MYRLTDTDIYDVCKTVEDYLTANKIEHLESLRLRMMLEEVLLNYQAHFGEDKEFSLHTRKMSGQIRAVVSLTGERFDPFVIEDDEDLELLSRMTVDSHTDCMWSYKDDVNIITIMPEKNTDLLTRYSGTAACYRTE